MKKISALFLAAFMLTLCACAPANNGNSGNTAATPTDTTAAANVFMAGFGEANITPDFAVGMTGYGNQSTRISTGKRNDLYVYVLAVRDPEGSTALIIGSDLMNHSTSQSSQIARWAEANVNVPAENVIFSSAHQHSTPGLGEAKYGNFAYPLIYQAIEAAIADLSPAEMYINRVETKALNFVRHYITSDGDIVTPNHNGDKKGSIIRHESDADNEMQLLKFKRGGDKKDILVVNFQAHPYKATSSTATQLSSDWIGILRTQVAEELDCNVLYFSGAGGNLADKSDLAEENKYKDFKSHGERAAKYVIDAEDSYTQVQTGAVKIKKVTFAYDTNHSMDHLAAEALPIYEELMYGDFNKASEMAREHPDFFSVYHARSVWTNSNLEPTRDMALSAVSIGDVAFTAHPYEMFDTNGMELKNGTVGNENYAAEDQLANPYKMTIITTIANGYYNYIPSAMGYANGGYATDTASFAPGTGEQVVGDMLQILNVLHD